MAIYDKEQCLETFPKYCFYTEVRLNEHKSLPAILSHFMKIEVELCPISMKENA